MVKESELDVIPVLTIKDNFPDVKRQMAQLEAEVRGPATARAINRTLDQGKTRVVRLITGEYNIQARVVRDTLRIQGASAKGGGFRIVGWLESLSKRGRSLNLIRFAARQTATGVSVQIRRGAGRQMLTGAFIANKGNAAGGTVFVRKGKARTPIEARQTIGVQQMFNARKVNDALLAFFLAKFPEVFEREARFYTERFNRKRAAA